MNMLIKFIALDTDAKITDNIEFINDIVKQINLEKRSQ